MGSSARVQEEQPPQSPDSNATGGVASTVEQEKLVQENERLKQYLAQYEQQIRNMESDLNDLRE